MNTKTLGLAWLPKCDQLKIKVNIQLIKTVTKRIVASDFARIFDPLGVLAPVVVRAKIFIQELWTLNEAVPSEFNSRWRNFRSNLKERESFRVHRNAFKDKHADPNSSDLPYLGTSYLEDKNSNNYNKYHNGCRIRFSFMKTKTIHLQLFHKLLTQSSVK